MVSRLNRSVAAPPAGLQGACELSCGQLFDSLAFDRRRDRADARLFVAVASWSPSDAVQADKQPVDSARIENSNGDAANWLSYGRTYDEQRFSPLNQINADNAKNLGLAWFADLDTNRGQEATPLVVDGVVYISTAWSMVKAYDGSTGKLVWTYDPGVARELGVNACCDVVSRGVAAWNRKIFVATFDGRLVALDAATGTPVWSTLTVGANKPYTITQAPRQYKTAGAALPPSR
jgi:glucose dehydrogenase